VGFRFVAPATCGRPASPSAAPSAAFESHFVGREGELALLERALANAAQGLRQCVFVSGEAGIGKTALVESLIEHHREDPGLWITQGRCVEQYGGDEACLPLLEALEQLATRIGVATFREVFARYTPQWLAQLAWLAEDTVAARATPADDTSPRRMLRELAQGLVVLCAGHTLALWLEDLHWCDRSSPAVLSFLAGRRPSIVWSGLPSLATGTWNSRGISGPITMSPYLTLRHDRSTTPFSNQRPVR